MLHAGASRTLQGTNPGGRMVRPPGGVPLLLATLLLLSALVAPASVSATTPLDYLREAQNRDGGFGFEPGDESAPLSTGWGVLAAAAAGISPFDLRRGGASPVAYLRGQAPRITEVGELERTILVVRAAGADPRAFGGRDLVGLLLDERRGNGSFAGFVSYTSFGILALRSSGFSRSSPPVRDALAWLLEHQNRDGGFDLTGEGGQSTGDDTGYALQALAAGGAPRAAKKEAVSFLRSAQNRDGGFPFVPGGPSNSQSTSYVVQGLVGADVDPGRIRTNGMSPLDYLRARTGASGRVSYSNESDQTPVWVTAQAVFALKEATLPLAPVPRSRPAPGADRDRSPGRPGAPRGSDAPGGPSSSSGPAARQARPGSGGAARPGARVKDRRRDPRVRAIVGHPSPASDASPVPLAGEGEPVSTGTTSSSRRGLPAWAVAVLAAAAVACAALGAVAYGRDVR